MSRPPELLESMREDVDRIDAAMLVLLAERYSVVQAIGRVKRELGLPPVDAEREAWILDRARLLGTRFGIGDYGRDLARLALTACKGALAEQPNTKRRQYPRAPHPKPGSPY